MSRYRALGWLSILALALLALLLAGAVIGFAAPASARTLRYRALAPRAPTSAKSLVLGAAGDGVAAPSTQHAARSTRLAVAHHAADYDLVAPPSVSAALIDRVLAGYASPAQGLGATFYDLGVQYGIDPAYALAFYIQESAAGTKGVARFTLGIGNIRTTAGYADYQGYRSYESYAAGIEDWYKLIRGLYIDTWGLHTPDTILPRYAPWGDNNNPVTYARNVEQWVDSWQEQEETP